ncbi:MAG: hypothetical protein KC912_15810 [Proteobacteria bacterium]|nr:hypothetical protein [Pseudomonadota bacterium]
MIWLMRTAMVPMMPPRDDLPGLTPEVADAYLAKMARETNWTNLAGVLAGSLIFVISPLITIGVPLPSFMLSPRLLDRHAFKLCTSPIYLVQQAVFLVKMYAGFAWGLQPSVRERLNLEPYPEDPGTWRTS